MPLGEVDTGDADGGLVVMLDGTTSSADEPDRVDDLVRLIDGTTSDQTLRLSIGSFGGSDDEVRYSPAPRRDRVRARRQQRQDPRTQPSGPDRGAHPGDHGPGGRLRASDPTSALRAGVRRLDGVEGSRGAGGPYRRHRHLGVRRAARRGQHRRPRPDRTADRGRVSTPSNCHRRTASRSSSAESVGPRRPRRRAVTFLIELNTALCEATGATCRVDPNLPTDV